MGLYGDRDPFPLLDPVVSERLQKFIKESLQANRAEWAERYIGREIALWSDSPATYGYRIDGFFSTWHELAWRPAEQARSVPAVIKLSEDLAIRHRVPVRVVGFDHRRT